MIVTVASGKGGTGKTLVSTSLALALLDRENVHFLDCDVEEPNADIFLKPVFTGQEKVMIPVPSINEETCTHCGLCADVCAYNAIAVLGEFVLTFPELCHGCGACSHLCPEKAITEQGKESGLVEWGNAGAIKYTRGTLNIGDAMAPPVIRRVKARVNGDETVIIDAPPGTSCPVVETVKGSDYCILVTEPTPFGLNDLDLAVRTVKQLDIPCGVILNRAGSGDESIVSYCESQDIPLLMKIPLEMEIARLYSRGVTLADGQPEWKKQFSTLFDTITGSINEGTGCTQR